MSRIIKTAEAIKERLESQYPAADVQRRYAPVFTFEDMDKLHITVVPKTRLEEQSTRATTRNDLAIDVAVQKKLASKEDADIDALMDIVESVAECVRTTRIFGDAQWIKTANDPIYSPEHLDNLLFTSVLTFTLLTIEA